MALVTVGGSPGALSPAGAPSARDPSRVQGLGPGHGAGGHFPFTSFRASFLGFVRFCFLVAMGDPGPLWCAREDHGVLCCTAGGYRQHFKHIFQNSLCRFLLQWK